MLKMEKSYDLLFRGLEFSGIKFAFDLKRSIGQRKQEK